MSINRKAGFLLSVLLFPFQIIASQTVNTGSNSLPDPKQVTGDPYAKEAYVFELIENRVQFEADGKGEPDFKMRVRIQSESAVREFGLLVYPYASSFESLEVLYVRVHKPDGTSVETPPSDIQELDSAVSREAPTYTDEREKHVAVKSLAPGDILEAHLRWPESSRHGQTRRAHPSARNGIGGRPGQQRHSAKPESCLFRRGTPVRRGSCFAKSDQQSSRHTAPFVVGPWICVSPCPRCQRKP